MLCSETAAWMFKGKQHVWTKRNKVGRDGGGSGDYVLSAGLFTSIIKTQSITTTSKSDETVDSTAKIEAVAPKRYLFTDLIVITACPDL